MPSARCLAVFVQIYLLQELTLCVSPVADPMAWEHDAFQHLWDDLHETCGGSLTYCVKLGMWQSMS